MPRHLRSYGRGPLGSSLMHPNGETRQHPLQAKAGTDPPPQGPLILDTRQRLDTFPGRIQQHQRGIANFMAGGKRTPLGHTQIRQDKCHLPAKLGPERVDDALELGTVRSAR